MLNVEPATPQAHMTKVERIRNYKAQTPALCLMEYELRAELSLGIRSSNDDLKGLDVDSCPGQTGLIIIIVYWAPKPYSNY